MIYRHWRVCNGASENCTLPFHAMLNSRHFALFKLTVSNRIKLRYTKTICLPSFAVSMPKNSRIPRKCKQARDLFYICIYFA